MYDIDDMVLVGRLFLILAAITTTLYPILYSFLPWYRSRLGRAVMLKAVAFCLTIWLKFVLTFFLNDNTRELLRWVNAGVLIVIGVATSTMTYEMYIIQRDAIKKSKQEEQNGEQDGSKHPVQ